MQQVLDPFRFVLIVLAGGQPTAAGGHGLSSRREPRPAGATRQSASSIERRSAPPSGGESQEGGPPGARCVASIVTPETLPAWHRKLIARKYDSRERHGASEYHPNVQNRRSLTPCGVNRNSFSENNLQAGRVFGPYGHGSHLSRSPRSPTASINPDALKIPASRAASTLTRSAPSPVPAEPAQLEDDRRRKYK